MISLDNGQKVGRVRSLVIDPQQLAIAALMIDQNGWFKELKVLPFASIHNIGDHAIILTTTTAVVRATALPDLMPLVKNPVKLTGTRVLTEGGTFLGNVEDFQFNPQNGKITIMEISGRLLDNILRGNGSLAASQVVTVGQDAIIVRADSEQVLEQASRGLQETVDLVKETSSRIWDKTRQTSSKLVQQVPRPRLRLPQKTAAPPPPPPDDEKKI